MSAPTTTLQIGTVLTSGLLAAGFIYLRSGGQIPSGQLPKATAPATDLAVAGRYDLMASSKSSVVYAVQSPFLPGPGPVPLYQQPRSPGTLLPGSKAGSIIPVAPWPLQSATGNAQPPQKLSAQP
jgi:hypothetical protein